MTILKQMFEKDIGRDIKGVIKVGQSEEENIEQELEEYVVTNELEDYFKKFYNAYQKGINGFTDKMGVWVSGFFGSGKSHFIKILSYLLENREVQDKEAINYFDDKITDQDILNALQQAGDVSTDVILFNIDSKSGSDSKSDKDAIVKVFMKVFNDYLGYCGDIPWLAELEKTMDEDGVYNDFKTEFAKITGDSWENRRHDFYYEEDSIIESLAKTTKMSEESARNWYYNAENNYSLSVEKFAKEVQKYIESEGNDHHVVFLVDEIGQYIGDDTQLMLNLQTVVEDLGIHCNGKAWVLVTSQQDIDSITKVRGGDFSKIQGRFDTRLNLSSANVDEVIRKRILLKKEATEDNLKLLYNEKEAILKNLITFSSDTSEMKNYTDENDFADIYPFIPYQFDLLQKVFEAVRTHGASGKHLSEGERSLLSAFQESALLYADDELGRLIPFSAFYESIKTFLDSNISRVIKKAQLRAKDDNSILEEYDVELLKLLFMIKYIDEVPCNVENITTLMVSQIDEDKLALKEKVEASLKRLVRETLIQKNGPEYMFLTNEEQDINREIKNTDVDVTAIVKNIGEYIFADIYPDKKYGYSTEYNFAFNQIIDDQHRGRQREEIGIKVLTPYSDYAIKSEEEFRLMSGSEDNVIVRLPTESNLLDEVEEALQLSSYLKKKGGTSKTETIEDIITAKGRELRERQTRVKELLIDDLSEANIYVKGEKLDLKSKDPVKRINQGFEFLIETNYKKLNYIKEFTKSTSELVDRLESEEQQVDFDGQAANHLAVDEVRRYIERQDDRNLKVTMKGLIERFNNAPYGWKELDIAAIVIDLLKAQEIKLGYNDENITVGHSKLISYLTKNRYAEKLIVKQRMKVEQRLINKTKRLAREVFKKTSLPDDEDGLMDKFQKLAGNEIIRIDKLLANYNPNRRFDYPGQDILKSGKRLLRELMDIQDAYDFYQMIKEVEDDLLDYEDDVEYIKDFFENQKEYYDQAKETVRIYEKDQDYIVNEDIIDIIDQIKEILSKEKPYSEIRLLVELRNEFNNEFGKLLEDESQPIKEFINNNYQQVKDELAKVDFGDEFNHRIKVKFDKLLDELAHAQDLTDIFAMKMKSNILKDKAFEEIESKRQELKKEQEKKQIEQVKEGTKTETGQGTTGRTKVDYVIKETVNINLTDIIQEARVLESHEDIEKFVNKIKSKLEDKIKDDKRVRIS